MPFRLEVHDVLANDDHAVALVTAFSSRGGESLEDRAAPVVHVKGGKISEFWVRRPTLRLWSHSGPDGAASELTRMCCAALARIEVSSSKNCRGRRA